MSTPFSRVVLAGFAALLVGFASPSGADAQQLNWPRATALPKPVPPPAPPPANLDRAPSIAAFKAKEADRAAAARRCTPGRVCVVCIAACDSKSPVLVQVMTPQATGTISNNGVDNDTDGVSDTAPRFARQEWAGITCGAESGCRGSGHPPRRSEVDVRLTIFQPFVGSSNGSTSRYIDR